MIASAFFPEAEAASTRFSIHSLSSLSAVKASAAKEITLAAFVSGKAVFSAVFAAIAVAAPNA